MLVSTVGSVKVNEAVYHTFNTGSEKGLNYWSRLYLIYNLTPLPSNQETVFSKCNGLNSESTRNPWWNCPEKPRNRINWILMQDAVSDAIKGDNPIHEYEANTFVLVESIIFKLSWRESSS